MQIVAVDLPGAYLLVPEPRVDERGFFARTVCTEELEARGLVGRFTQSSISFNLRRGTVRGMHYSIAPDAETKIVRCTAGELCDVLVDLRPGSSAYLQSQAIRLSAENRHAIYIPIGIAHGFQTLRDETEVLYAIDVPYVASSARGLRWNDPALTLRWPEPISTISERDLMYADWLEPSASTL